MPCEGLQFVASFRGPFSRGASGWALNVMAFDNLRQARAMLGTGFAPFGPAQPRSSDQRLVSRR